VIRREGRAVPTGPTPSRIAGVVDGTVQTYVDADGLVWVNIAIGECTEQGTRIEFVLSSAHARQLGATLVAGRRAALHAIDQTPMPCSVGIQLRSDPRHRD
jgi:hypothetical protein